MAISDNDLKYLQQQIDKLSGTRTLANKGSAAVTLDDLNGLLALPLELQSTHAAGDPATAAEFNALVDDVRAIHIRLLAGVTALRARRGRTKPPVAGA